MISGFPFSWDSDYFSCNDIQNVTEAYISREVFYIPSYGEKSCAFSLSCSWCLLIESFCLMNEYSDVFRMGNRSQRSHSFHRQGSLVSMRRGAFHPCYHCIVVFCIYWLLLLFTNSNETGSCTSVLTEGGIEILGNTLTLSVVCCSKMVSCTKHSL